MALKLQSVTCKLPTIARMMVPKSPLGRFAGGAGSTAPGTRAKREGPRNRAERADDFHRPWQKGKDLLKTMV